MKAIFSASPTEIRDLVLKEGIGYKQNILIINTSISLKLIIHFFSADLHLSQISTLDTLKG